ncbi:hypothetical protein ES705_24638 [subsurface metagenome]
MPKERIDWRSVIVPKVSELLDSYSYRPTLRQVFYRLVAALLIPNTETTYKSLSRATVQAREEAIIDPLCFDDRVRTYEGGDQGYESPQDYIDRLLDEFRDAHEGYTKRMWDNQQRTPIIWLEKDALFTPVSSIANRYNVRTYAARGYSSFTAVYEAAQTMDGSNAYTVLQLTDFDPSGEDMVRDLERRLTRYEAEDFVLMKIALTQDQVQTLGLPPMPAKTADPRYDRFAASYGSEAVELDALPPDELERIVREAIESRLDRQQWNEDYATIETEKEKVRDRITELLDKIE